ncbi:MAG: trypsin-like peptidase domain-containing protein [Cytophagales bacterium]|nr:trypsin-like peptidase domain-containing protein [Cytophagales bacterium]
MKNAIVILATVFSPLCSIAQDLSAIFEKVSPAVVQIQTKEKEVVGEGQMKQTVTAEGLGSGILISSDGHILTAAHVVQTAEEVKVVFKNNETIPAKIISTEKAADVALIKLVWPPSDKKIHIPKVSDSDLVKTGEQIFVIGSPYGLAQSLSVGHISGRHEKTSVAHNMTLMEFFQTDAAINTGNSGGPMFNMKGEVIGIVSYILSESGGFQGLGFAATSNMATKLLLEEKGIWFGVDAVLLSGGMAKIFNLPQDGGLLIQKVADLSPGAIMGLRGGAYNMEIEGEKLIVGGDIILSILGKKIGNEEDMLELSREMKALNKGDKMDLTVMRGGSIVQLNYAIPE